MSRMKRWKAELPLLLILMTQYSFTPLEVIERSQNFKRILAKETLKIRPFLRSCKGQKIKEALLSSAMKKHFTFLLLFLLLLLMLLLLLLLVHFLFLLSRFRWSERERETFFFNNLEEEEEEDDDAVTYRHTILHGFFIIKL